MERLKKQMEFIIEVDKLKDIIRQTNLTNGERKKMMRSIPGILR